MHEIYLHLRKNLAHYVKKLLGKQDLHWYLYTFERAVNVLTWRDRRAILDRAENELAQRTEHESIHAYENSTDPIVKQGWALKKKVEAEFKNKLNSSKLRILIHLPDAAVSPAGYSLFTNMIEAFNYIGIPAEALGWHEKTAIALNRFRPNIILSGDHASYLSRIDWNDIATYRANSKLLVGLTASLAEYGNTPLLERLQWGKEHAVDFYYSYREQSYIEKRAEYKPFFDAQKPIFSIPFGANPLLHYPIAGIDRDLNYVFIASTNKGKAPRYCSYLKSIVSKYPGFIDGPGWKHNTDFNFNLNRDRYIYARAKIGINIHLEEQILWANETNERTYQLAACGVPQVTDHAGVLDILFEPHSIFIADTPAQFKKQFEFILKNPKVAEEYALRAQKHVFEKYTTFHRALEFATILSTHFTL